MNFQMEGDGVYVVAKVQIHGVAIRHDETMEADSHARLAEVFNSPGFPKTLGAGRDEDALPIMGVNVMGHHGDDGSSESAVQSVHESCFKDRALKQGVLLGKDWVR